MRARLLTSLISVAGIALAGSVAAAPAARADEKVIAASGILKRVEPPATDNAARQLVQTSVRLVFDQNRATATVVLAGSPTTGADQATLRLTVGESVPGGCDGPAYATPTVGDTDVEWQRTGPTTYVLDWSGVYLDDDYDCAAVELVGSGTRYDYLFGTLVPEHAQPALQVDSTTLLGKPKLNLVPGVWTKVDVDVRNTGQGIASQVVVQGRGKGLKVKSATVPYDIYPGSTGTAKLTVKLKKKRKSKLVVTVLSGVARATANAKVKPAQAPSRLRAGTYRSKDKSVTFRVKGNKVVGFRVRTQTTCGGYPNPFTYTTNWYDMPTFKLPKSGIVDVTDRGDLYSATLGGRASGKKVKATFRYSGPDRCRATKEFTAKRIG
ncbi:hypothetical protein [Nocardioides sp. L-11A]|uniref:hypothetical protein n=1 Tax=Nocardioides sp. L-11A TaxID=3043848 RepID=UPI00249B362D|nr:hypothetical protein QJ852_14180 [Nocardioides sp. L-11A]